MTGEVRSVHHDGTVAVLYLTAHDGAEVAVACEPRMARDIEEAIAYGQRPVIEYESWQVLFPMAGAVRVSTVVTP